jgi:alginate O-acetyltransferase complex protein AlgI
MTFNAFSLFANVWVMLLFALPAYHLSRNIVLRRLILLTLGILIIFFVAPRLALAYLIFWTIVVIVQRFVLRTRDFGFATPALLLALALVLAPMVTWKLSPWWFMWELVAMRGHAAVAALSSTIGSIDANHQLFLPLGLSFATFRALDLLLQTYLHEIQKPTALSIMSYGFCPFLLPVGPIATIQEVDVDAVVTEFDIKYGLYRIVSGLVKVFLLASIFEPWGGVFTLRTDLLISSSWGSMSLCFISISILRVTLTWRSEPGVSLE